MLTLTKTSWGNSNKPPGKEEYAAPKYDHRSSGHHNPAHAAMGCWGFWAGSTGKTAKAGRGVLWTPLTNLKRDPQKGKRGSWSCTLPQTLINHIGLGSVHHTQINLVTSYHTLHLFFSRPVFIFLKNHLLPS